MIALGYARVFLHTSMRLFFTIAYAAILVLAWITARSSPEFLAIGFDSSGSVTGILVVPFIMALAVGISKLRKDSKQAEEDSFGLVGAGAVGPILGVMIMNILKPIREYPLISLEPTTAEVGSVMGPFWGVAPQAVRSSIVALLPLAVSFLILQRVLFKLEKKQFQRMLKGFIYTLLGTFLFFMGVDGGFMELGSQLGYRLASLDNRIWLLMTSLPWGSSRSWPSLPVLNRQIEEVTAGSVGLASPFRWPRLDWQSFFCSPHTAAGLTLWHLLLPGRSSQPPAFRTQSVCGHRL